MDKAKQAGSSFTSELFGSMDSSKSSSSSNGLFGSLFGPSSTGLGKDSMHGGITGASSTHHYSARSAHAKQDSSDYKHKKNKGERIGSTGKDPNSIYQNEVGEPCYMSSSIYYGGQEVYSAAAHNPNSQQMGNQYRKDGGEDDPNGKNATRGDWWQGSLYY